ncbi:hypothetical protein ACSFA8_14705 [Variovorax sp. RT4R15]|uniref:hypothetical protein n=1 Tax=Variovorax sp. RT4R15 TaxID=3443737 RepID=UPI003F476CF6
MEPVIDIRKVRSGVYSYHLAVGGDVLNEPEEGHQSVTECLEDAAREIGDDFPIVRITYSSFALGSFPTTLLANAAEPLADELMARVSALIDATQ